MVRDGGSKDEGSRMNFGAVRGRSTKPLEAPSESIIAPVEASEVQP